MIKSTYKITSDALRFWLKKAGIKQGELAERTGISQGHISNMMQGTRGIPTPNLEKICEALDISLPEFFSCKDEDSPDIVFVQKVKARPRAGTGGLETDGNFDGKYAFHSSFISRKQGNPEDMVIFQVAGDSMSPTLADGDLIMINRRDKDVRTGYIYLLRMEDELMVKRLENRPGSILLIRSDNSDYEDIAINKSEIDGQIEIFGRMVWSCREY